MSNKKPTNKERDQQITFLTQTVISLQKILSYYISWRGDEIDFKKHLVDKEAEEKAQNDTSNASKVDSKEG